MKRNIRVIYDTWSFRTADFFNFNEFLVKTLKIHIFANNRPIFTGLVLNYLFYRVLHFFFCIKVDFIKNKKVIQLQSKARLPSRPAGQRLSSAGGALIKPLDWGAAVRTLS